MKKTDLDIPICSLLQDASLSVYPPLLPFTEVKLLMIYYPGALYVTPIFRVCIYTGKPTTENNKI